MFPTYDINVPTWYYQVIENLSKLSRIFAIEFAERLFGLLPKGTHEWDKFVTG